MSYVNIRNLPDCSLTEQIKSLTGLNSASLDMQYILVAGIKETSRLLADGSVVALVLAQDMNMDMEATKSLLSRVKSQNVPIIMAENGDWLGEFVGIRVSCGVASLVEFNNYQRVANSKRRNKV